MGESPWHSMFRPIGERWEENTDWSRIRSKRPLPSPPIWKTFLMKYLKPILPAKSAKMSTKPRSGQTMPRSGQSGRQSRWRHVWRLGAINSGVEAKVTAKSAKMSKLRRSGQSTWPFGSRPSNNTIRLYPILKHIAKHEESTFLHLFFNRERWTVPLSDLKRPSWASRIYVVKRKFFFTLHHSLPDWPWETFHYQGRYPFEVAL